MNLLLSFFIMFCAVSEEPSVHIIENPAITTDSAVLLKDIATLSFLAADDEQALGNIQIAESPEALKKMSSRDIMRKIRPQLRAFENHCECKLQITIPHALIVRSLPGNFAVEKVQSTMEHELRKDCPLCEFEISPLNIIRGAIPQKYTRWDVDLRSNEWRGPAMIRVYFDQQVFDPLVFQTLVKIKRPILKLKRSINNGESIGPDDVEAVMTDVTYERKRYAKPTDLSGTETKRTLAKGYALTLDDLAAHNLIRIGQRVEVEVLNKAFSIEMSGVAQRNGKLGEQIPVRINKTQKSVSAEVISDSRVRME
jgi:flagella basal body P-ring formation protein FlgA